MIIFKFMVKIFQLFLAVAERWQAEERERNFHVPPNIKKERKYFSRISLALYQL
jgi:hypothetical protein